MKMGLIAVLGAYVLGACVPAWGQGAGSRGAPANCHGMFTATLKTGRAHGDLDRCAPYVLPEVVEAIEESDRGMEDRQLLQLLDYASRLRDDAIFDAALRAAENPSGAPRMRVLGLLIGYALLEPGFWPNPHPGRELYFSVPAPEGCSLWSSWTGGDLLIENALRPDHLNRLEALTRQLSKDAETPETVRRMAACAPDMLSHLMTARANKQQ
jgi:hypothetical protein